MSNSYIQNLINLRQQEYIAPVAQNDVLQSGKKQGILNTNIKPESPKGYIVKENALQSAGSSITGLAKTGVYFVKAMNGEGTDYTVGRINDGARFLGSLGIAAALASTAKNPKAKMMEFVGFATWFASMALWPKMLGTAVKATKGVDINQEYVDSYGRRKGFFQDAQYITWDLYKDKDLQKMGDKLGVPKNIENRNDAIKEKAKQVATQGNTLMMLTAGFATPLATALICNGLEKPVSKVIERYQLFKAGKGLEQAMGAGFISNNGKALEQLGKILGEGTTARLDINEARQVRNLFRQFEGTGIGDGVSREVKKLVGTSKLVVQADNAVTKALYGAISLGDDTLKAIVGGSEEHFKVVKEFIGSINQEQFGGLINQAGEAGKLNREGRIGLKQLVREALGEKLLSVEGLRQETRNKIYKTVDRQLHQEFKKHSKVEVVVDKLKSIFKAADDFKTGKNITDQYAKATIANIADSQTAMHWENTPKILKALGIKGNLRKLIENDPFNSSKYLEQHLRELTKPGNEVKLNIAVEKTAKTVEAVIGNERKAAAKLIRAWRKIGSTIKKSTEGYSALDAARKDAVRLEISNIRNKVKNTEGSFYKILLGLERTKDPKTSKTALREISTGLGIDFWSNKGEHLGIKNTKKFGQFIDEIFAPLKAIGNKGLRVKVNKFYKQVKTSLGQIDGANRGFYFKEYQLDKMYKLKDLKTKLLETVNGNKKQIIDNNITKINKIIDKLNVIPVTKDRSNWAIKVGQGLDGFTRDAAKAQGIKNSWLKLVLFVAIPVAAISLLAISQFGKKNKYNPDIYEVKGNN